MGVEELLRPRLASWYFDLESCSWESILVQVDSYCSFAVLGHRQQALMAAHCKCTMHCVLEFASKRLVAEMKEHLLPNFLSCHYSHWMPSG